jgi:uncharacterized protein YciI
MITAFAAYCRDGRDAPRLRREHLQAHLDHVERVMACILLAGPLKGPDGADAGSLIVLAVANVAEAQAMLDADPYFQAGVWDEIRIERFVPVAGTLIGGRNW